MVGLIVLLAWVLVIARLWATVRFPSRARWYLTGAVALFASNQTLQLNAATIDRLTGLPNISILAGRFVLIWVGVAVLLFFDSELGQRPGVARRVIPAAIAAAIVAACWAIAPIHQHHLGVMAITQLPSIHVALVVSDGYLIYWATVLAKRSWLHAIRRDTDFSRLGLFIISIGALERALASVNNIIWVVVTALPNGTAQTLSYWSFTLSGMASFFVAAGAGLSVFTHGFHLVNTHRRLGPLWQELTREAPQVVLPLARTRLPGSGVAFRATRRRIEIIDSLFRLSLEAGQAATIRNSARPEIELGRAISTGLLAPQGKTDGRVLAGNVLPAARIRSEETAQLLRIADGYRRVLPGRSRQRF